MHYEWFMEETSIEFEDGGKKVCSQKGKTSMLRNLGIVDNFKTLGCITLSSS